MLKIGQWSLLSGHTEEGNYWEEHVFPYKKVGSAVVCIWEHKDGRFVVEFLEEGQEDIVFDIKEENVKLDAKINRNLIEFLFTKDFIEADMDLS